MKIDTDLRRVPTRFSRSTRFKLRPRFVPVSRDHTGFEFEQLKTRLLNPVLSQTLDTDLLRQLRLAANEAAAVAWSTPFPMLVLPVLLEEKTAEARVYARRQEQVHSATDALVEAAL